MKRVAFFPILLFPTANGGCALASALSLLNYGRNLLAPSSTSRLANLFEAYTILQEDPPSSFSLLFHNTTSSVEATTVDVVAGTGLVAKQPIETGRVVALYPIHALGYAQGKEPPVVHAPSSSEEDESPRSLVGTSDLLCWEDEARHFGVNGSDDQVEEEKVDYSYAMLDPSGRYVFDVNPSRPLVNYLFLAHFVNDATAATFDDGNEDSAAIIESELLRYLQSSSKEFNCVMTPFGPPPLMAYVTIKPVEKGQELLASYGLDYWLGKVENEEAAARIQEILDTSPRVQQELEKYDHDIDSMVEQATEVVGSELCTDASPA